MNEVLSSTPRVMKRSIKILIGHPWAPMEPLLNSHKGRGHLSL